METLASAFIYRHTKVRITTERPTEFIDLTESLEELLAESRIVTGFVRCTENPAARPASISDWRPEPVIAMPLIANRARSCCMSS